MASQPGADALADAWMVNLGVASPARIYDFFLGGKDNFEADRDAARQMMAVLPGTAGACLDNRAFLQRAVRFLAGEAGIRQFLDIGTGLPTQGNVHEVAQESAPDAKVAYVDHDTVVLAHARALLAGSEGRVIVVDGDLRQPGAILADAGARLIDFSRPVAVLLVAVLHFIGDDEGPYEAVQALKDAMAPGSYLVVSHATPDDVPAEVSEAMKDAYASSSSRATPRTLGQVTRFFDGLELAAPGVVSVADWRPGPRSGRPRRAAGKSLVYGGIAVKRLRG